MMHSTSYYGLFGDAICFDTTFKTNNYDMVCAPLVGVNHHWQTTLFGCGLLEGETTEAITWLLNTFLEAMGEKAPQTIFTDQSAAIANAIESVFPNTHHRLCLWHIYQNAAKHLSSTFTEFKEFAPQFRSCIYNPETVCEFESRWAEMLEKFGLTDNEWLQRLFMKRKKWALVYGRAYFCAGMTTTQRSESINKFLKDFFSTTTILREFVQSYMKAMDNRREKERVEENRTRQTSPILFGTWTVESEASKVYTKKLFYMFQEEYKKLGDLDLKMKTCDGDIKTYSVLQLDGHGRPRTLTYKESEQSVSCTCRKFDFEGILCCHALKLFRVLGFTSLPSKYYLNRWSKSITDEIFIDHDGEIIPNDTDPTVAAHYSELSHMTQKIVAMSVTSGTRYSLAKESLLELQKRIIEIDISGEEHTSIVGGAGRDNNVSIEQDVPIQNPKNRKVKGQQKKRKKSVLESKQGRKNRSKKLTESVAQNPNECGLMSQPILLPNLNDPSEPIISPSVPPLASFSSMIGPDLYYGISWQDTLFARSQESQPVTQSLFSYTLPNWSEDNHGRS